MRIAFAILLLLHGAVHLLGLVKGFGLAEVAELKLPIGRTGGIIWSLAALGFMVWAVMLFIGSTRWWVVGLPTLLISQVLIFLYWSDAKFGTIPNIIALIPLVFAMLEASPNSFRSIYERESARYLALIPASMPPVTEKDLEPLPPLVRTYLGRAGVVGKPHVLGFRARFHGRFRNGLDSRFMNFTSEQHNFITPSVRLFFMRAFMTGIPVDGFHNFVGNKARMRIRIASLFNMVDGGGGAEGNQAETVTVFNDICVMAPGVLVDLPVRWTTLDAHSVRGVYSRGEHTVSAVLKFDERGDLVDFASEDRYYSEDGKRYKKLPWSTPLHGHRDFAGRRLPARGDAVWKTVNGDFVYGEFNLDEVAYFPPLGREVIRDVL
jgi:hypothetical protein